MSRSGKDTGIPPHWVKSAGMVCPFLHDKDTVSQTLKALACLENGNFIRYIGINGAVCLEQDIIVPRHSAAAWRRRCWYLSTSVTHS